MPGPDPMLMPGTLGVALHAQHTCRMAQNKRAAVAPSTEGGPRIQQPRQATNTVSEAFASNLPTGYNCRTTRQYASCRQGLLNVPNVNPFLSAQAPAAVLMTMVTQHPSDDSMNLPCETMPASDTEHSTTCIAVTPVQVLHISNARGRGTCRTACERRTHE